MAQCTNKAVKTTKQVLIKCSLLPYGYS